MATEIVVRKFGESIVYVDADPAGHFFLNDGRTKIYCNNNYGSDVLTTFTEQEFCDFEHDHVNDSQVSVSGDITMIWLTHNRFRYNDDSGYCHFTADNTTGVTYAAVSETLTES